MTDTVDFEFLGRQMRQDLSVDEVLNLEEVCAVFEFSKRDSDGEIYWVYTVGGLLNGVVVGGPEGGALVGGEAVIVHARDRGQADELAYDGLMVTIKAEGDRHMTNLDNAHNAGIIASVDAALARKH